MKPLQIICLVIMVFYLGMLVMENIKLKEALDERTSWLEYCLEFKP